MYVSAVAKILSAYPARIVMAVTDVERGLPVKNQWLPTLAELKAACEAAIDPERKAAAAAAKASRVVENFAPATPDERTRAVERWKRIKAEMAEVETGKKRERDFAQNEDFLAECKAMGGALQGVQLSDHLLASLCEARAGKLPQGKGRG